MNAGPGGDARCGFQGGSERVGEGLQMTRAVNGMQFISGVAQW